MAPWRENLEAPVNHHQPGIPEEIPAHGLYLTLRLVPGAKADAALRLLKELVVGEALVVGLGPSLVATLGGGVPGLAPLTPYAVAGVEVPSTPSALWLWLRGEDAGVLVQREGQLLHFLSPCFRLEDRTAAFCFREGRDLTGYVDGTENPEGEEAREAAFTRGAGTGLDGGSYVAVQRWVHDLDHFGKMAPEDQDHVIGRRISDNEEIDDAPESAHVKRTAQEDYDPPAFMLRRSMPWADPRGHGLVFVAFGHSLSAFERQLARMAGTEDGVTDALFRFSHPVTSASYWCPPVMAEQLDLRALGRSG